MHETDVTKFISDLDGGVFEQKLGQILTDVAAAVIDHGDKGKTGQVMLTFDMKRIGNSAQVEVKHTLKYKRPTMKGSISEDNCTSTPMHVGTGGRLSLFSEDQTDLFQKRVESHAE